MLGIHQVMAIVGSFAHQDGGLCSVNQLQLLLGRIKACSKSE